eukprot:scpid107523/ scgid24593/ 
MHVFIQQLTRVQHACIPKVGRFSLLPAIAGGLNIKCKYTTPHFSDPCQKCMGLLVVYMISLHWFPQLRPTPWLTPPLRACHTYAILGSTCSTTTTCLQGCSHLTAATGRTS